MLIIDIIIVIFETYIEDVTIPFFVKISIARTKQKLFLKVARVNSTKQK